MSGGLKVPLEYGNIDYVAQESDLRTLAHGPIHEWAEIIPQHDGHHWVVSTDHPMLVGTETSLTDTQQHMSIINADKSIAFLKDCSEHLSSFLKARILQDRLHGLDDAGASVKNGLAVAVELGLPSLQVETSKLLGGHFPVR